MVFKCLLSCSLVIVTRIIILLLLLFFYITKCYVRSWR